MRETWNPRTRDPTQEGRDSKAQDASSATDLALLQVGVEGCGTPGEAHTAAGDCVNDLRTGA